MADQVKVDYGAFRHVDLTKRWRGATAAREQTRLTALYESYLETALQTPMYKNLPTGDFKYDWQQLRIDDGSFVSRIRGTNYSNYTVNSRVNNLSPKEMDTFCAEVFNKATALVGSVPIEGVEDFWVKVAQKLAFRLRAESTHKLAFYDWAMKLVAARIIYCQETSLSNLQNLPASDTAGDVEMTDRPNKNEPDMKPRSLAARAVDRFLAAGISKYGTKSKKLKAITRYHTVIPPIKPGSAKASIKDSTSAKDTAKSTQVHMSYQPTRVTSTTISSVRLRRSPFGSLIGVGEPAWWGFINRTKVSKKTRRSRRQRFRNEPQHHTVTTQGGSDKSGTVDDLIIGMHGTSIKSPTKAPRVLTNLAVRTINPLKRRREDAEGAEDGTSGGQPLAKMVKVSDGDAEFSSPPTQPEKP